MPRDDGFRRPGAPLDAADVSLVYFPDDRPGITRRRCGRGFSYFGPDGSRITDAAERRRLAALAVPPAYERVWMCPLPHGHLQATGRDAKSRKQYRYHPDWTAWRNRRKFAHQAEFGAALPRLRRKVARDLKGEAGDRQFALAAVVSLLDLTAMRLGHPANVERHETHGATTLSRRHVRLKDGEIRIEYRAKGGRRVRRRLRHKRLHKVLQSLDDLPGRDLIAWMDESGETHSVTSQAVNDYIAETVGDAEATAKTFRTWAGTVAALEAALDSDRPTITGMAEAAAERLANTPAIARTSYIHPSVVALVKATPEMLDDLRRADERQSGLRKNEARLLRLLGGP